MVAEDTLITETSRTDQTTSFHENFAQIALNNRTDYISLRKCNSSPIIIKCIVKYILR